nr:arylesterase [Pigmentiphaga humi]
MPAAVAQTVTTPRSSAPVLLVLGDSLSAGYGLPRETGWVTLLEKRLRERGHAYRVANASISGDTTSGGASRLPALLAQYQPGIVVIELGANDALRGLSLQMTEANLDKMAAAARQAGARVLLVGMQIPPNYGRAYTERFKQLYAEVARRQKAALAPFLLEGVAQHVEMFQADRLHPTIQAQPRLLENVWPHLEPLLEESSPSAR